MSTKVHVIANANRFVKLGVDVESRIVQTLDAMSALAYLSTSKRTSLRAAKESLKIILRDLKVAASIQLPASLTPNNLQIFHTNYASMQVQLKKTKQFLAKMGTNKNFTGFSMREIKNLKKSIREINGKQDLKDYMGGFEGMHQATLTLHLAGKHEDFWNVLQLATNNVNEIASIVKYFILKA